jgi:hypothetical protein
LIFDLAAGQRGAQLLATAVPDLDLPAAYRPPRDKGGVMSPRLKSLLVAALVPQAILLAFTVAEVLIKDWRPPAAVVLIPWGAAALVSIKAMHQALWPPDADYHPKLRGFMSIMIALTWMGALAHLVQLEIPYLHRWLDPPANRSDGP